jgi:hypothetical protein
LIGCFPPTLSGDARCDWPRCSWRYAKSSGRYISCRAPPENLSSLFLADFEIHSQTLIPPPAHRRRTLYRQLSAIRTPQRTERKKNYRKVHITASNLFCCAPFLFLAGYIWRPFVEHFYIYISDTFLACSADSSAATELLARYLILSSPSILASPPSPSNILHPSFSTLHSLLSHFFSLDPTPPRLPTQQQTNQTHQRITNTTPYPEFFLPRHFHISRSRSTSLTARDGYHR